MGGSEFLKISKIFKNLKVLKISKSFKSFTFKSFKFLKIFEIFKNFQKVDFFWMGGSGKVRDVPGQGAWGFFFLWWGGLRYQPLVSHHHLWFLCPYLVWEVSKRTCNIGEPNSHAQHQSLRVSDNSVRPQSGTDKQKTLPFWVCNPTGILPRRKTKFLYGSPPLGRRVSNPIHKTSLPANFHIWPDMGFKKVTTSPASLFQFPGQFPQKSLRCIHLSFFFLGVRTQTYGRHTATEKVPSGIFVDTASHRERHRD